MKLHSFLFQAFQQNTIIMSTTNATPVVEVTPPSCDKPKKKFQVVPVPGEFTRGRWKVIDTRFGSAMGEFGNYPPDDEYKMIVTEKNNVITVRKKFPRPPVAPEVAEADSIRVLQKSQPRLDQVPVTNQIKILIMDPETAAVAAESLGTVTVTEVPAEMTSSQSAVAILGDDPTKMDDSAKLATATSNTVVAIDNKIVQAMDLVKTHLTFAVREEVETLRTTITDLEARLQALREENKLLRENVSPDVLAFISANKQIVE
uniref:Sequence orphan n=2 Tax=Caenorhabditis tropicalis TaxID=1561998 RepID=A0A1I7US27_9PELO